MKTLFTLALLAVTTIASAQPRHHKNHHKHKSHHKKHYEHKYYRDDWDDRDDDHYHHNKRRVVRYNNHRDYHYYANREMSRYDFLRLSRSQRSQLQVSLNFMIANNYGPRDYERRLRRDLGTILTRDQFGMWERRAYTGGGNTFVFNFNR
ncbi:hypothetical protein NU10_06030 [Flavobacterium dauae]|uniref:hypothetical protein n=1 Tax=Flavobacterium dauae TaxID=1563479 RepID=UPI00101C3999|nr:hypothetical protein [Flavobacterium dauae]WLD24937.1 hypothetical protein NU10_06030 [Flavobacterium dauae]